MREALERFFICRSYMSVLFARQNRHARVFTRLFPSKLFATGLYFITII